MAKNYSGSKCPSCESSNFELIDDTPINSSKISFVRCCSCKHVVGVLDAADIGYLIKKLAEKLNVNLID